MTMKKLPLQILAAMFCLLISGSAMSEQSEKLQALLVSGQMNEHHNMALMDQVVTEYLEQTGLFEVSLVSTPPAGENMREFAPDFSAYDVVVLNYDGDEWSEATKYAFEKYLRSGGGLVSVHSTDNAFPEWQAFLEMTGVGGWGERDESWGPAVFWGEQGMQFDYSPGQAFHPEQHVFPVTTRNTEHPVTAGMPATWLHAKDELYSCLRGPAQNMQVLATGYADQNLAKVSDKNEPAIMALSYGEGRVFHSTLGHIGKNARQAPESVRCAGFISTLQRGAEWAATGVVSQPVPEDFPGPDSISVRP